MREDARVHAAGQRTPAGDRADGSGVLALSATALMEAIDRGELSCVDVARAYLQRIDETNPTHNAIVAPRDAERVLEDARAQDGQRGVDGSPRLLRGMPQAPKDLMPVAGMKTTMGSLLFRDVVPTKDAAVIARMRASGAIFVGRTNTPEFGLGCHTYNPVYGFTRNAWDAGLSAGGSSGGAAAAVALRMLPVADGSDMMGSLRTPAAFNGIYGFRPTPGLIVNDGPDQLITPAPGVEGPMARNVPDLALLLSVMAGFPGRLPFRPIPAVAAFTEPLARDFRGVRVAWLGDLQGYLSMEPGVLERCERALHAFEAVGCEVVAEIPEFDYAELWRAWVDLRSYLFFYWYRGLLADPAKFCLIKPEAQWEFRHGREVSEERFRAAVELRGRWIEALDAVLSRCNFLLAPTAQTFPFPVMWNWPQKIGGRLMDTYHRWMEVVILSTMGGLPALSVPAGDPAAGKGTGLQILGRSRDDLGVLQLGYAYQLAAQPGAT